MLVADLLSYRFLPIVHPRRFRRHIFRLKVSTGAYDLTAIMDFRWTVSWTFVLAHHHVWSTTGWLSELIKSLPIAWRIVLYWILYLYVCISGEMRVLKLCLEFFYNKCSYSHISFGRRTNRGILLNTSTFYLLIIVCPTTDWRKLLWILFDNSIFVELF